MKEETGKVTSNEAIAAMGVDGLRVGDTWDGCYWRDDRGRVLTICHEEGRRRPFVVCGHPVPGGVYCANEGRRENCPTHPVPAAVSGGEQP